MPTQLPHPLREQYENDLNVLSAHLLGAGRFSRHLLADAAQAASALDPSLAQRIVDTERDVARRRDETDRLCTYVLARWAPGGGDLRLVATLLKVDTELERIGEQAVNIARRTLGLGLREGARILPPPEL